MANKKNIITLFSTRLTIISMILSAVLLGVLIFESRFFYVHAQTLCELKEDYRSYTASVKKMLKDYNRTKERLDMLENYLELEKKKERVLCSLSDFLKNSGTIFLDNNQDEGLVLVNRDYNYLHQAALAFIKQQNDLMCETEFPDDAWLEYTDLLSKEWQPEQSYVKSENHRSSVRKLVKKKRTNGIPLASDILFSWPVERSKCWLSSLFGPRSKPNGAAGFHFGLDMAAFRGTPVTAAAAGIVIEARWARGYGQTIVIAHNRKYKTRYAHLDKILVTVGQKIKRGALIAKVGATGNVRTTGTDGSHLHFEVHAFNRQVNPLYFLADDTD